MRPRDQFTIKGLFVKLNVSIETQMNKKTVTGWICCLYTCCLKQRFISLKSKNTLKTKLKKKSLISLNTLGLYYRK